MTKKEEIKWIDMIIELHGHDSYLGEWLKENREAIVRCIKDDLPLEQIGKSDWF